MSVSDTGRVLLIYLPIQATGGSTLDRKCPLGLLYLDAVLRQDGFDTGIIDFQDAATSWRDVEALVEESPRCLVGYTCDSDNIFRVLESSDRLLRKYVHVSTVLGGPHVTCVARPYVTERRYVIRGEGEYPLLRLAHHLLRAEGTLQDIPSLTYLCEGEVRENEISYGPFEDIDKLAFPNQAFMMKKGASEYVPGMVTSRGCLYNCHFCSEGRRNHRYRPRSIDNVERELRALREHAGGNIPFLMFADDTFTVSPERVMQMADALDRVFPDKAAFGFYCEGRVNVLGPHPELIHRLKRAGLLRLQIGIESGNQGILDRMNKATRIEQIEKVVATCYEANIPAVFGAFMCGLPGQTMDDLKRDIEFAKHLADLAPGQSELEASVFVPLPGTELQENAEQWGISIFDPEYVGGLITNDCFSETTQLSRDQIRRFRDLFRAELQKHCLDQIPSLPISHVKEFIVLSIERHMVPLVVRLLNRFDHVKWILAFRARQDHRFLCELPASQWGNGFPLHVANQVRDVGGRHWINEGSPKAFVLNDREKSFYDLFCGKLTFFRAAEAMAGRLGISTEAAWNECLAVYQKCEDNLAAIVMI